jgi:hypothetical protein
MLRGDCDHHVTDSQSTPSAIIEGRYSEHAHIGSGRQDVGEDGSFQGVMTGHVVIGDIDAWAFRGSDQYHDPSSRSIELGANGALVPEASSIGEVIYIGCREAGDGGLSRGGGGYGRGRRRGTGGRDNR